MLASLLMRALDQNGAAYLPYSFVGNWSAADRASVDAVMAGKCPPAVDAGFNNWEFYFEPGYCTARRFTWEVGQSFRAVTDLCEFLRTYYGPKE